MQQQDLPQRGELLIVLDVRNFSFPVNGWTITMNGWIFTLEWRQAGGVVSILHVLLLSAGERLVPTQPAGDRGWH